MTAHLSSELILPVGSSSDGVRLVFKFQNLSDKGGIGLSLGKQ
jgi:hypothetical protein